MSELLVSGLNLNKALDEVAMLGEQDEALDGADAMLAEIEKEEEDIVQFKNDLNT